MDNETFKRLWQLVEWRFPGVTPDILVRGDAEDVLGGRQLPVEQRGILAYFDQLSVMGADQFRAHYQAEKAKHEAMANEIYRQYASLSWWTVKDAAQIICGFVPPAKDFPLDIAVGGERARLYWELKNVTLARQVETMHVANAADNRIRPWDAIAYAATLGIIAPPELANPIRERGSIPDWPTEVSSLRVKVQELEAALAAKAQQGAELSQSRESKLLKTIGALLCVVLGKSSLAVGPHPEIKSQTNLADLIASRTGLQGLSKRNLEDVFSQANAEFDSAVK